MRYKLTYQIDWDHDGGFFYVCLDPSDANTTKIFDNNGVQIGNPTGGVLDTNIITQALEEAEVEESYSVDETDEFWIGPILVQMERVGGTHTVEFTSEDIKVMKDEGGVAFREAKLHLETGVRWMMRATGDAKRTRSLVTDILNEVMTEEVMSA